MNKTLTTVLILLLSTLSLAQVNSFHLPVYPDFTIAKTTIPSNAAHISMDGFFSDWETIEPIHLDPTRDQLTGDLDFGHLWIANDERFLYIRIEVEAEINLQNDNAITLYLDTDNNTSTASELEWNFGDRYGRWINSDISAYDIGLVTMPTITSNQFEIAIDRIKEPLLFSNDTIQITFVDRTGGDRIPDEGSNITYKFNNTQLAPIPKLTLSKQNEEHLRVLSYNVLRDGIWNSNRTSSFERILRSIKPDIIGFQEIYSHTAEQTEAFVEIQFQERWYSSKVAPDIITISRYPIIGAYPVTGNGAFLIDLRPEYNSDLLFIVAHPPCCNNNTGRQLEIDAIMAFIRDNREYGRDFELKIDTPIMIIGDLNLVGYAEQLETLLTGEIVNVAQYGSPFTPDWDGTDFTALLPRHTDLGMYYTWYDEGESFSPGRLDYIIFSDSVLEPANHFILFTPEIAVESLVKYGLEAQDAIIASDHLPVVGDFILPIAYAIKSNEQLYQPSYFSLEQNYPNPFNPTTMISFKLYQKSKVKLSIYNLIGEEIKIITHQEYNAGYYKLLFNAEEFSSGLYFYKLEAGNFVSVKKMAFLK
jgi:exonuclease III